MPTKSESVLGTKEIRYIQKILRCEIGHCGLDTEPGREAKRLLVRLEGVVAAVLHRPNHSLDGLRTTDDPI
jgi:hypothetical protein